MDDNAISQQPYLTFFSDETAEYDVIVDQSSSAPNLKEATWGAIQPLLPIVGPTMGPEEMALILEYSPMPESFLEKFTAIQDKKAQQPPPPDPEMMKIEAMKQAKAAELQMRQQEAQVEMQVGAQQNAQQMQMEQQKTAAQLDLERQKAAAQIELEQMKAAAQVQLEREKAQVQLMMDRERMGFEREKAEFDRDFRERTTKADMDGKLEMARFDAALNFKENPEQLTEMLHDKKLTAAIEQMTQAMTALAQSQMQMVQSQAESNQAIAQSVAQMGADLSQAMTKPKQIVRGPDGRATGVQ